MIWRNRYVNMTDIILWTGEAGCVVNSRSAGSRRFITARIAVVLGKHEEPCYAESGGVSGVDDAVEDVEAGER